MNPKVDLTLYNQIKTSFSVEKGHIGLISLTSEKIENLVFQVFPEARFSEYWELLGQHVIDKLPYAVLDHLEEYIYLFVSKEFLREESLETGRILEFKLNPLKKIDYNSDTVRKDLAQLAKLLLGNSEAS